MANIMSFQYCVATSRRVVHQYPCPNLYNVQNQQVQIILSNRILRYKDGFVDSYVYQTIAGGIYRESKNKSFLRRTVTQTYTSYQAATIDL